MFIGAMHKKLVSRNSYLVSRILSTRKAVSSLSSRFTLHASRFTLHASRFTLHASRFTLHDLNSRDSNLACRMA
jgi:hypothetical protein